jgi:monoamine oxidase
MEVDYDAVVIGAGFAGLIAARETSQRGLSTVIFEGNSRIGGRTHSTTFAGHTVEMGGTYIHWTMPHVWAEITRYGLTVAEGGDIVDEVLAPVADGRRWYTAEEHDDRERRLLNEFFAPSATVFPKLYEPMFMKDEVAKWDISADERLRQVNFSPDDEAFIRSLCSVWSGGDLSETGFLSLMRWYSLGGHDYDRMAGSVFGTVIKEGTSALHEAILDDSGATLKLNTSVAEVDSTDHGVRVTTQDGETVGAHVCIVATPASSWVDIEFTPSLSEDRLRLARTGVLRAPEISATKVLLKGERRRFYIMPEESHPIGLITTVKMLGDDLRICRVMQHPSLNAENWPEVEAGIKDLLPHTEILEHVTETYYSKNPLTRGGWGMYHAGVLSREEPQEWLGRPEGRVAFATADIAKFWHPFIDGAIESGMTASRLARGIVREGTSQALV